MNIKKCFLLFAVLTFFNAICFSQTEKKPFKVVVDAGHGGEAPGCIGKKSKEKDVTLAVALKVGELISTHCPDVQVIYTRKTDINVEVYKRAEIANKNHADLFISIHCNAVVDRSAHGVETYVMGIEKSEANFEVAKKENADILLEKNYENNYEGFNPSSSEANIIFSLYSSAYLKNSIILADRVQRNLVQNTKLFDRNVKQAGFWVLYKVAMPSILIELGFLSNPTEETFILKESTQDIMAASIFNAFVDYRNVVEGTNNKGIAINPNNADKPETPKKEEVVTAETSTDRISDSKKNDPGALYKPKNESKTDDKVESAKETAVAANDQLIRFRVQFFVAKENVSVSDKRFANLTNVKHYFENNLWKYTSGDEMSFEAAQELLKSVKQSFPDAFIIAFKNERKIPVAEARELLNKK